jgi:hypothetical protein
MGPRNHGSFVCKLEEKSSAFTFEPDPVYSGVRAKRSIETVDLTSRCRDPKRANLNDRKRHTTTQFPRFCRGESEFPHPSDPEARQIRACN